MSGNLRATSESGANQTVFRLTAADPRLQSTAVLDGVSSFLSFVQTAMLPNTSLPEVQAFWSEVRAATLQATLDSVLLPAMPSSLSTIPKWLELVHLALKIEEARPAENDQQLVKHFFESQAGEAWAKQRRGRVAEEVRKLVLGGWGGWEAREAEREKEVSIVVEVEVDDEPERQPQPQQTSGEVEKDDDAFGWGFDDSPKASTKSVPADIPGDGAKAPEEEAEDGWGFDTTVAGPSTTRESPKKNGTATPSADEATGDGWDFEDPIAEPDPEPPKPVLAKPAREAKRLGKKVAKVKAVVDDDPWGSGSESVSSSHVAQPPQGPRKDEVQAEGWGWDEPESAPPQAEPAREVMPETRVKRKELKEETRVIRETFLVSRACDKLVDVAERVLKEAQDVQTAS
jgi:hypothetical protein